jgi:hypothetical protein
MRTSFSKYITVTTLAAVALFLFGCPERKVPVCGERDQQWTSNLALWQSKRIVDYDMVLERFRDPMYRHVPFLIKVRKGRNVSLEPARENLGLEKADGYEHVSTVEEMFNTIRHACERGDHVNVEYDVELGVPKYFGFSNIADGVDHDDGYKLERLTPVYE